MLPKPRSSRLLHKILHRFLFSTLPMQNMLLGLIGKSNGSIPFTVLANPSSIYFNYKVKADRIQDFETYINLAPGFSICPMQCLEGEEADYLLTLNVYEVTGMTKGKRAEWSTYVRDAQGVARYMVLEPRSSKNSLDAMDIFTRKSRVEHEMTDEKIVTTVASIDGKLFESSITLNASAPLAKIAGGWIAANDFIYWRTGICDRVYYGEGLANATVRLLDEGDVQINDQTHWAEFVEARPKHVLQYENPIDFMIVMWANL